jgi:hypothetical protein
MEDIKDLLLTLQSSINHLTTELSSVNTSVSSVKHDVRNLRTDVQSIDSRLHCLEIQPSNTKHVGYDRGASIQHPEASADHAADVSADPAQPIFAPRPMCPPEDAPAPSPSAHAVAAAANAPTSRVPASPVSPASTAAEQGRLVSTVASPRLTHGGVVPRTRAPKHRQAAAGSNAEHTGAGPDAGDDDDFVLFWRPAVVGEYRPQLAGCTGHVGCGEESKETGRA